MCLLEYKPTFGRHGLWIRVRALTTQQAAPISSRLGLSNLFQSWRFTFEGSKAKSLSQFNLASVGTL